MLARFTQIDYDREMALIATVDEMGRERQIAVCRYVLNPTGTLANSRSLWRKHGRGAASVAT